MNSSTTNDTANNAANSTAKGKNSNAAHHGITSLERKADIFLEKHRPDRVIVALSGGADSVALLLYMKSRVKNTVAVHVNHSLRGAESDRDEAFCEKLCKELEIPLYVKTVDVKAFARQTGKSTEEAARILRYRAFEEVSGEETLGETLVATAHNADDNAETMVFNLIRGTGLTGLAGIPAVRDNFIRPFLTVTREEILEYLGDRAYVTDSTNLSDDYSRNFIRRNIIPLMKKLNPAFITKTTETAEILTETCGFIKRTAQNAIDTRDLNTDHATRKANLKSIEPVIRREAILAFFRDNNIEPDYKKIAIIDREIAEKGLSKVEVGKSLYICFDGEKLLVKSKETKPCEYDTICINYGESVIFGDKRITLTRQVDKISPTDTNINSLLTNNALDCGRIEGEKILRRRLPGDRYVRSGNDFHSKLKTLYNSLPPDKRADNAVIADERGIIWVEHFGAAARVAVTDKTTDIVYVKIDGKGEND